MSTLVTSSLLGTAGNNWAINTEAGSYLYRPGMILQTVYVRTESQTTFSAATTGDGTTITPLGITITPRRADSLLICTWMINGEASNPNIVFLAHKDGSLITTTGYEGYNNQAGNLRYSGIMSMEYDTDQASTQNNMRMQYFVPAGSTTTATYAPAVRCSYSVAQTYYLNRTVGSAGTNGYEISVSTGMIQEIAQ